ncbi:methyl-accepting chemotaxis protein [Saccharibacillus sp. JS10]|uniref:methyl-accepting chemotaxis protein n=1 Tax=Saccharibacillus sp. JS10 TaxID=2950552 RepID=UPI00210DA6BC|nr:methyl-accepting chemotaxis protein [Saccharibacillus sp. JS10]MCQ4086524.1 methyl-accepting chemotaxis protein [Saccharibacillus sp. JS10]
MPKYLRNRSLIFNTSALMAIILLALIVTMSFLNYKQSQKDYYKQIEQVGIAMTGQLKLNVSTIEKSLEQLKQSDAPTSSELDLLKTQLDAMVGTASVANAYLFNTDIVEKDGNKVLKELQANQALHEYEMVPGVEYVIPENVQATYDQVFQNGSAMTGTYTDAAGTWVTYLALIKSDSGQPLAVFGLDLDAATVKKDQMSMLLSSIGIGLLIAAILITALIILARIVLKPLQNLASVSKLAADGDLTVNLAVKSNNEIGHTAQAFNHMIGSLQQLIQGIQSTSTNVTRSASDLQMSAEKTTEASQEITESMLEVSSGAEAQQQATTESQISINEMAVGIRRIAESTQVVAELASDATNRASKGEVEIVTMVEQMQKIEHNMSGTVTVLHELQQLNTSIQGIMSFIREIAEQTNLLALNASIEAARAGESGKGFAVVAQEIHKLAGRSKESSDQIDVILQGILGHTEQAVASIEESVDVAKKGAETSDVAAATFRQIVSAIQQVSGQVYEVSAASEQMSASSDQIAASLTQLGSVASNTSTNANKARSSSEEQLALMQEVSGLSQELKSLAVELNQVIQRFQV